MSQENMANNNRANIEVGENSSRGNVEHSSQAATKVTGVVKFYSVQKCYGFIKRDDSNDFVFVHSTSITGKNHRRVTRSLDKGERVQFDVIVSDRSPEAVNVTGPDGGPVLGSEYGLVTMQWHQFNAYKQSLSEGNETAEQGDGQRDPSPRARRYVRKAGGGQRFRGPRRNFDGEGSNGQIENQRPQQRFRGGRRPQQFNRRNGPPRHEAEHENDAVGEDGPVEQANAEGSQPRKARRVRRYNRGQGGRYSRGENGGGENQATNENGGNQGENGDDGSPKHAAGNNETNFEPKKNQRRGGRRSNPKSGRERDGTVNGSNEPSGSDGTVLADISSAAGNNRIAATFNNGNN